MTREPGFGALGKRSSYSLSSIISAGRGQSVRLPGNVGTYYRAVGDGATASNRSVSLPTLPFETKNFDDFAHGQPFLGHLCPLCFRGKEGCWG